VCYLQDVTDDLDEDRPALEEGFAHECRIRDLYAARLNEERPYEMKLKTEHMYVGSRVRADLRTIDRDGVIRVWEFKLFAGYEGLGQVQTYLALDRKASGFQRPIKAVLAAFDFQPEVREAVEILNLGIELVQIPPKFRLAGGVPTMPVTHALPRIPHLSTLLPRATTGES
jgi:hypothetical protein